ncbi:hypothetical protein KAJ38_03405, partial [Candidatus Pacearchaeota archaeon]|nr:hypothetical protein [Candidatus Pacearchaeota archaeon]
MDKKFVLVFLFFVLLVSSVSGATYYVCDNAVDCNAGDGSGWSTGIDSNTCLSKSAPCKTISGSIGKMVGGDILIIGDGTYGENLYQPKSGISGNYTIIRAENNFGVTLKALDMYAKSHIQIEGINFRGGFANSAGVLNACNHIKILRCSFSEGPISGNAHCFVITGGSDILVEECWAFGTGRYKFHAYRTKRVIFRRCVARHSYHDNENLIDWGRQSSCFTRYDADYVYFQNCIAIDSGSSDPTEGILYGGIWNENNNIIEIENGDDVGCIMLNLIANAGINDPKISGDRVIKDTVIWDVTGGGLQVGKGNVPEGGTATFSGYNLIIGNIKGTHSSSSQKGIGFGGGSTNGLGNIKNSIIYDANNYAFSAYVDESIGETPNTIISSSYNALYGNGARFYDSHYPRSTALNLGTEDTENIDPTTNSLKYLMRIEAGSDLATAGDDGGPGGATILKKIGVSGTLYGEPGWDTVTNEDLWPFPNEDEIKEDMASYSGPGPSGNRGFCTDGNGIYEGPITLTSYIWEYLGNKCPPEICNYNLQTCTDAGGTCKTNSC